MAMLALGAAHLVSSSGERPALTLADLDRAHETLMSCSDGDSFGSEPMWCADPSSPHCVPAAPPTPAPDFTDHSSPATLRVSSVEALGYVLVAWPEPRIEDTPRKPERARLDRPPRA